MKTSQNASDPEGGTCNSRNDLLQKVTQQLVISQETFTKQEATDGPESRKKLESNLFAWGNNTHGQLSLPPAEAEHAVVADPIAIFLSSALTGVAQVACGSAHTLLLTENGDLLAFGDNQFGQLGSDEPGSGPFSVKLPGLDNADESGKKVKQIACAARASFAIVTDGTHDELYAWGDSSHGVLGLGNAVMKDFPTVREPLKVEFGSPQLKVDHISAGDDHCAAVMASGELFAWGSNACGQLGLNDISVRTTPTQVPLVEGQDADRVSCGSDFSFLISAQNEIMITGKLPFTIDGKDGSEAQTDFIVTFQSIAQFDSRVKIVQIDVSKFASIIVDPVEDDQPKELFLWGQSPLGVFNDLTPLNPIFAASCADQPSDAHLFDVKAVKNGRNFCIFVDQASGMTYQIGAEGLTDPYLDEAIVSLSELRDATFTHRNSFGCGDDFVVGWSAKPGFVEASPTPQKQRKISTLPASLQQSPSAKQQLQQPAPETETETEERDMSMRLISPDGSKHSFPQRALCQGSISPSTPTERNMSVYSMSLQKSIKFQPKELVGAMKHLEGCRPMFNETTNNMESLLTDQVKYHFEKEAAAKAAKASQENEKVEATEGTEDGRQSDPQLGTAKVVEASKFSQQHASLESHTLEMSQAKEKKKPSYSPDISPIGGLQDTLRDSCIDQNWMEGTVISYPAMMIDKQDDSLEQRPSMQNSETRIRSRKCVSSSQMPLQMQTNSHVVYQSLHSLPPMLQTHPAHQHHPSQQPIHDQPQLGHPQSIAQYLPVQQSFQNFSTAQTHAALNSSMVQPAAANLPFQSTAAGPPQAYPPLQQAVLNQSQLNVSGLLNMSQQVAHEQVMQDLMQKERQENAQLRAQIIDLQKQLDKSRKDYSKLLSQIDEDQEETSQLKERTRQQEAQVAQLAVQLKDKDCQIQKAAAERERVEKELAAQAKALTSLKEALAEEQAKVKSFETRGDKCTSDECKAAALEMEQLVQRKGKQIYDLTVKLGCFELENKELRSQVQETNLSHFDNHEKYILQQELADAQGEVEQLRESLLELTDKGQANEARAQREIAELRASLQQAKEEADRRQQEATAQVESLKSELNEARENLISVDEDMRAKVETLTQQVNAAMARPPVSDKQVQAEDLASPQASHVDTSQSSDIPKFCHTDTGLIESEDVQTREEEEDAPITEHPIDIPAPIYERILKVKEQDQSFDISISFNNQEERQSSPGQESLSSTLREFTCIEKATQASRHSDAAHSGSRKGALSKKTGPSRSNYQSTIEADPPKHNFLKHKSQQALEPKILRKSDHAFNHSQRLDDSALFDSSKRNGQNLTMVSKRNSSAANSMEGIKPYKKQAALKSLTTMNNQNASQGRTQAAAAAAAGHNYSSGTLGKEVKSKVADKAWLSMRPQTTRPNDRYSLEKHTELMAEHSSILQPQPEPSFAEEAPLGEPFVPAGSMTQRRAKSNSEMGALQMAANKQRRLRHQRQKNKSKTNSKLKRKEASCENASQESFGAKSDNMVTLAGPETFDDCQSQAMNTIDPLNDERQADEISFCNRSQLSQLKQPTSFSKSPALTATLTKMDSNAKGAEEEEEEDTFQPFPVTSRNHISEARQELVHSKSAQNIAPMTARGSSHPSFSFMKEHKSSRAHVQSKHLTLSRYEQAATKGRPSVVSQQVSSRPTSRQNATKVSATPRVNSQGSILQNASNKPSQSSAAARRIAYDHKRRHAIQSMKTIQASPATHQASNINRQARAAVANANAQLATQLSTHQASVSLSLGEDQPRQEPPEQTKRPEVSVQEESELPTLTSARLLHNASFTDRHHLTGEVDPYGHQKQIEAEGIGLGILTEAPDEMKPFATPSIPQSAKCLRAGRKDLRSATAGAKVPVNAKQKDKLMSTTYSALTSRSNLHETLPGNRLSEPEHLVHMKDKLQLIQSNKLLLEQKIQEYESKLKKISQCKTTQQVMNNHQHVRQRSKVSDSHSTENFFHDQSDYTLGELNKPAPSQKSTPKNATGASAQGSHERNQRRAFQTIGHTNSQSTPAGAPTPQGLVANPMGPRKYRECYIAPPQQPMSRIKTNPANITKTRGRY